MRLALRVTIVCLLAVVTSVPQARSEPVHITKKVVVRPGDSLGRIAARNKVAIDDLRRWNVRKIGKNDLIRLGDTLEIRVKVEGAAADEIRRRKAKASGASAAARKTPSGPVYKGLYAIEAGDTLGGIARKLKVTTADLMRWNNLSSPTAIRAGSTLKYERSGPPPRARSVGLPAGGRLVNGQHLGRGFGYRLRFPTAAYGLPYANTIIRKCAAHVAKRFPGTAKILVGDLSKPGGGPFPPHASHQSGRDADIGYYLAGNRQNKTLHQVGAYQLDYSKNWAMLRCFLRSNHVVRIYMDTAIQKGYVKFMRRHKLADDETIVKLFGAVSDTPSRSLIRHAPGHDTHLHIRFACEPDDARCQEEPKDKVFRL